MKRLARTPIQRPLLATPIAARSGFLFFLIAVMELNVVVADLGQAAGLSVDADQGDFHAQHNSRYHPHFDPHWRVAQVGVQ